MKLILIDGGPASGKNTLGKMVADDFIFDGEKSALLDLDTYVEKYCPTWKWDSEQKKESDLAKARTDFINDINKFLQDDFIVLAIGERFLTEDDVIRYTAKLLKKAPTYLYHLSVPFALRQQRLHERGPHSLIDLDQDQKDRDQITSWPGHIYQNINSPEVDAKELIKLIQKNVGLIKI